VDEPPSVFIFRIIFPIVQPDGHNEPVEKEFATQPGIEKVFGTGRAPNNGPDKLSYKTTGLLIAVAEKPMPRAKTKLNF
jgi:hypothetical protein